MLGIGWVIFWKGVVLGVGASVIESWRAFRKRRIEQGLKLRKNRHGVYVASDWTQTVDIVAGWLKRVFLAISVVGVVMGLSATAYMHFKPTGRTELRELFQLPPEAPSGDQLAAR